MLQSGGNHHGLPPPDSLDANQPLSCDMLCASPEAEDCSELVGSRHAAVAYRTGAHHVFLRYVEHLRTSAVRRRIAPPLHRRCHHPLPITQLFAAVKRQSNLDHVLRMLRQLRSTGRIGQRGRLERSGPSPRAGESEGLSAGEPHMQHVRSPMALVCQSTSGGRCSRSDK